MNFRIRHLLLAGFLLLLGIGSATAQGFEWAQAIIGADLGWSPGNSKNRHFANVAADAQGNTFVASTYCQGMELNGIPQRYGSPNNSGFVAKYSTDGEIQWVTPFPAGVLFPLVTDVKVNSQGEVYVCAKSYVNGFKERGGIFKFNRAGQQIWADTSLQGAAPMGIAINASDEVFVTGEFTDTLNLGSAQLITPYHILDVWVAKYAATGNVLWAMQGSANTYQRVRGADIAVNDAGEIVVGMNRQGTATLGNITLPLHPLKVNMLIAKMSPNGTWLSTAQPDTTSHYARLDRLKLDATGNTYLIGIMMQQAAFGNTVLYSNGMAGVSVPFVAKCNANGTWAWAHQFTDQTPTQEAEFQMSEIALTSTNELVLIGSGDSKGAFLGNQCLPANGPYFAFFLMYARLDTAGNITAFKSFEDPNQNFGITSYDAALSPLGDVHIIGQMIARFPFLSTPLVVPYGGYPGNLFVAKLLATGNRISGTVFRDLNNNGTRQPSEPVVPGAVIEAGGYYYTADQSGHYQAVVGSGNNVLSVASLPPYYTAFPAAHSVTFPGTGQTDTTRHFALQASAQAEDLQAFLTALTPLRHGQPIKYRLTYRNMGTVSLSGTIIMNFDPALQLLSSSLPAVQTGQQLSWTFPSLPPFYSRSIDVSFALPLSVPAGSQLTSFGKVLPSPGEMTPDDNVDTLHQEVVSSFDPNDKQVNLHVISTAQVQNGKRLDYTIRFQNTGTDTAFTVVIVDSLSALANRGTVEVVAASHPYTWSLSGQNKLRFNFQSILLPDSTTNIRASQGFIRYRVKTLSTLQPGDSVLNQAHIYFDFNAPVATNTTLTEVIVVLSAAEELEKEPLQVWPNPSSGLLNVQLPLSGTATLTLTNSLGQQVYSGTLQNPGRTTLSLAHLPTGMYLLKVNQGGQVFSRTLLKQK